MNAFIRVSKELRCTAGTSPKPAIQFQQECEAASNVLLDVSSISKHRRYIFAEVASVPIPLGAVTTPRALRATGSLAATEERVPARVALILQD